MTGHSGFGAADTPSYGYMPGTPCIEQGGTNVRIHIRDLSGEGNYWHEQGKGNNKTDGLNDFGAAACWFPTYTRVLTTHDFLRSGYAMQAIHHPCHGSTRSNIWHDIRSSFLNTLVQVSRKRTESN